MGVASHFRFMENTTGYGPRGGKILHFGLDKPEKMKSVTNISGIWIEEPTEIENEDEFNQIDERLRKEINYLQMIRLSQLRLVTLMLKQS